MIRLQAPTYMCYKGLFLLQASCKANLFSFRSRDFNMLVLFRNTRTLLTLEISTLFATRTLFIWLNIFLFISTHLIAYIIHKIMKGNEKFQFKFCFKTLIYFFLNFSIQVIPIIFGLKTEHPFYKNILLVSIFLMIMRTSFYTISILHEYFEDIKEFHIKVPKYSEPIITFLMSTSFHLLGLFHTHEMLFLVAYLLIEPYCTEAVENLVKLIKKKIPVIKKEVANLRKKALLMTRD